MDRLKPSVFKGFPNPPILRCGKVCLSERRTMHKWQCPKCGQKFRTEVALSRAPICNRQDRRVTHPVAMVRVATPTRA